MHNAVWHSGFCRYKGSQYNLAPQSTASTVQYPLVNRSIFSFAVSNFHELSLLELWRSTRNAVCLLVLWMKKRFPAEHEPLPQHPGEILHISLGERSREAEVLQEALPSYKSLVWGHFCFGVKLQWRGDRRSLQKNDCLQAEHNMPILPISALLCITTTQEYSIGLAIGTNVTQWKSTAFKHQTLKKKMKKKKKI